MNDVVFNRVLSCRTLPSLPAVALQVLDLTRDPGVSADKLAVLIQGDPGLATKLLKTVNSSYYGLRQPCADIGKAVSLMGLSAVKSLALGFSLIETTGRAADGGFDLVTYWRRAVYAAAAARALAKQTKRWDPEEAFVAALLQDIGMLAIRAALKSEYDAVLTGAPLDHADLCAHERQHLGFDHAEVGAALVEQWRLPIQLVETTRRHHEDEPGTGPHAGLVELIQLACLASLAIVSDTGCRHFDKFRGRMETALGLSAAEADEFLRSIGEAGSQLSLLLKVNTGQKPDVRTILAEAHERLAAQQEELQQAARVLETQNTELTRQATTDALTGAMNRRHFDEESARLMAEARREGRPLSVAFCDADRFKSINDAHGHQVGDVVLKEIARRLASAIGDCGQVCRYGGEEFAVLLPGVGADAAIRLGESMRAAMEAAPVDVAAAGAGVRTLPVTMSVGVATFDLASGDDAIDDVRNLISAADQGVYAAKSAGRNCVRRGSTRLTSDDLARVGEQPGTPSGTGRTIVLVEEDPLAAKLLEAVLGRTPGVRLVTIRSGTEAIKYLAKPANARPDLVIADAISQAPGGLSGLDLTRSLRSHPTTASVPVVIISSDDSVAAATRAKHAGATAFFSKAQMCADLGKWIAQVTGLCATARAA